MSTFGRAIHKNSARTLSDAEFQDERAEQLRNLAERKRKRGVDVVEMPEHEPVPDESEQNAGDDLGLREAIRRSLQGHHGDTKHNGHTKHARRRISLLVITPNSATLQLAIATGVAGSIPLLSLVTVTRDGYDPRFGQGSLVWQFLSVMLPLDPNICCQPPNGTASIGA